MIHGAQHTVHPLESYSFALDWSFPRTHTLPTRKPCNACNIIHLTIHSKRQRNHLHGIASFFYSRSNPMSASRFLSLHHFFRRPILMEAIQQKAKLTDDRIQQLKSLIANVGTSTRPFSIVIEQSRHSSSLQDNSMPTCTSRYFKRKISD